MTTEQITVSQDGDSCGDGNMQTLKLSAMDGGAGFYYVIETERWAFDTAKDLTKLIESIEKLLETSNKEK